MEKVAGAAAAGMLLHMVRAGKSAKRFASTMFGAAPEAVMEKLNPNPEALTFFHADFCPFANRVWIALLEKEADPRNPVLFDEQMCCYFMGNKDPGTALLFGMNFKTVPAAVHHGQTFTESAELADYIDDIFPNAPLKPSNPVEKYNMVNFIKKHTALCSLYYGLIMNQDPEKHPELAQRYEGLLKGLDEDLGEFEGPYLCGEQFTLADLHIFGFIERSMVVLPVFKDWQMPKALTNVFAWYESMLSRPSVKVVTGDRSLLSRQTMAFEAIPRKEYLVEMYECYANNEVQVAKDIHKEGSRPGYNAYRKFKKA